ncbi:hypothetical protein QBC32DRAFT_312545 [Pseudoneurospora amorphoporcata]|uniref:Uncharacterized protein n=1 Tax=Pseudoneurospora amorphoporcata TaxID=241081 RepID=A0AAN6SI44_9PEZI|nr:hypothetical protein QBC32DRAFT_312545 [Pseudoneurospora amorphoporcata]
MGEWTLFKIEIEKTVELNNHGEHSSVGIRNQRELPATSIEPEDVAQPQQAEQPPTPHHSIRSLSHSATKVRRDLFAAKGRVRSMIDAFNGRNEVSLVVARYRSTGSRSVGEFLLKRRNRQDAIVHSNMSIFLGLFRPKTWRDGHLLEENSESVFSRTLAGCATEAACDTDVMDGQHRKTCEDTEDKYGRGGGMERVSELNGKGQEAQSDGE